MPSVYVTLREVVLVSHSVDERDLVNDSFEKGTVIVKTLLLVNLINHILKIFLKESKKQKLSLV